MDDLKHRVAVLESRIDQLESELSYTNELLIKIGFPDGIQGLKETIEEVLSDSNGYEDFPFNPNP